MKKAIALLLIALLIFSCFNITALAIDTSVYNTSGSLLLRAGGGGGGGGSGGGGSGGGSATHHSGSGQNSSLLESVLFAIVMPFFMFSSSVFFYIKLSKRSRKAKKLMKQMAESDSAWKFKNITQTVEDGFIAIQNAWADMNLDSASQYLSDELLDSFQTKLNWMAYKNQKNVLKNIRLLEALPVAVYDDSDNSRDYVWFYIKGSMVDYIIDTNTQTKLSGNTASASFVEYWQFIRKDSSWVLNKILQKNESDQIPFEE